MNCRRLNYINETANNNKRLTFKQGVTSTWPVVTHQLRANGVRGYGSEHRQPSKFRQPAPSHLICV